MWRDKSLIDLKASSLPAVCVCVCLRPLATQVLNDRVRLKVLKPDAAGLKIKQPNEWVLSVGCGEPPPGISTNPAAAPSFDGHLHLPNATPPTPQQHHEGEANLGNDKQPEGAPFFSRIIFCSFCNFCV